MTARLVATAGPLNGRVVPFTEHEVFLLERSKTLNPQIRDKERFVSRIQFLLEVNPPRARLVDMGNPSGTFVNGKRVNAVELAHFDEIKAGYAHFRMELPGAGTSGEQRAEASSSKKLPPPIPRIPEYRIERELGRGPFGAVYEAVREEDNASVAIKTIVPAAAADSEQVDKFLKDVAQLWKMKTHPHIVPYSQVGEEDGILWFAMERIVGTDLGSLLKESGKRDEKTAVRLTMQILSALEHAHSCGLGHGNLKTSNVFIEEQPDKKRTIRVADFGVARAYAMLPMSGLSFTDCVNQSVDCLAPEQIANFRSLTASADQFSAAVTMYRLLTDQSPYNVSPTFHLLGQIVNGSIISLGQRRRDLSPKLVEAVERALAHDPADRFPDIRSFAEALFPFAT
ncbi:MAG TPA: protein kinase [Gemmataceae bacterium]|nr:protein kinase [Gemmataceae bacterium]